MVASTSVRKVVGVNADAAVNSCGLAKPPGRRMSCNTTPPLSLPGRGWGDSGSSGCVGHFGPSYSNSLYDGSQGVHSSLSGGSRGSLSSGVSSGYGDGDEGPIRFRLEDGFSSAEEETWGSEGEIEETTSAGRYAVVGTGRRRASDGGVAAPRCKGVLPTPPLASSGRSTAESFGSGCCGGGGSSGTNGGGGGGGAEGASDEEAREALLAPFCGSGGVGAGVTEAGRSGASLALGGRRAARKAAVGAGRAKRAVALAPGGDSSSSSRPGEKGGSGRKGAGAAARRGRRCGGSGDGGGGGSGSGGGGAGRACKRPLRLSRPLFIEIENKASEPPLRVAGAAAGRAGSVGVMGGQRRGQQSHQARPQSAGRERDDGELEDSDDEGGAAWCGCAQRCLRQAEVWYQTLTGAASVKFSEVGQASPSSLSAAV